MNSLREMYRTTHIVLELAYYIWRQFLSSLGANDSVSLDIIVVKLKLSEIFKLECYDWVLGRTDLFTDI